MNHLIQTKLLPSFFCLKTVEMATLIFFRKLCNAIILTASAKNFLYVPTSFDAFCVSLFFF